MPNPTELRSLEAFRETLASISPEEIAWFSGWLCADGSIKKADRRGRPKIRFVICDADPLQKFSSLFGNKVFGPIPPTGLGKKPRYEWSISGLKAVALIERCMPWLSFRYAERARKALDYKGRSHMGRKLTPTQIISIKDRLANGGHGTGRQLAKEFGVTSGLISAIKMGRVWA